MKEFVTELQKNMEATVKKRMANPNLKLVDNSSSKTVRVMPKVSTPNPRFPAFSKCVDVHYESTQGRYGRAKRNIRAGEILLVEDPCISRLGDDLGGTGQFCARCFLPEDCMIPSPFTTLVSPNSSA